MAFIYCGRLDDDLQWKWDTSLSPSPRSSKVFTDKFRKKYPGRLPRGPEAGRVETRASAGTRWTITAGATWDAGDLLRLNDPAANDYDLRELANVNETVIAVAACDVVDGASAGPDANNYLGNEFPAIINVEGTGTFGQSNVILFAVTDVNNVTPTDAHIGAQAALDNTVGWQIDVTGAGAVEIVRIEPVRGLFIVKFLPTVIQENPHS